MATTIRINDESLTKFNRFIGELMTRHGRNISQSEAFERLLEGHSDYLDIFEKVEEIAIKGLLTDGGHHKQYCLEEILKAMGRDLDLLRQDLEKGGYSWESGIPY